MRKQSRIISVFLGLMLAVAGVFSQAGFAPTAQAQTSPLPTTALSSIMGYSQNGDKYNYVYFGEYPKTRVLKQIDKGTEVEDEGTMRESVIGDYTPESIAEETTIKGYIKTLNETYYRNVLNQPAYMWSDDTGSTTQIQNFYPQEDFENENISFDFRSGYYTLKTAVGTYPMGSKFHTYNQTVAYYEKMGSGYDSVSFTGTTGSGYVIAPTSLITAGTGPRTYNYSQLSASKIYIFTVEPIKWRVLANDGNKVTLLADTILDSMYFKTWHAYQTEWAYSDARGWLNGKTTTTFSASTTPTTYTRYYEGRNFLTRAFTPEQAAAITEKQIIQDSTASFYAQTWHIYDESTFDHPRNNYGDNKVLETTRPTTQDKIYFLSNTELNGYYHSTDGTTEGGVNVDSGNTTYSQYGFSKGGSGTASNRIAYNTDYSVATGNYDRSFVDGNYSQNTSSGNGGNWWSRSASACYYNHTRFVYYDGGLYYTNSSSYSYGVRPALNLSISAFNDIGLITETASDTPAAAFGTSVSPISLSQATLTGGNQFALWNFASDQSNAQNSTGSLKVVESIEAEGAFTNKVKVTFSDIKVGTALYARVNDATSTLVFGVITPLLTSASNTGETFFTFTSTSPVDDSDISIYSAENYSLFTCGIFEADDNPDLTRNLPTVYLDPAQTNGGNDSNTGKKTHSPVATLERARSLVAKGGTVIFMSTLTLSEDTTLNFGDFIVSNVAGSSYLIRVEEGSKVTVNDLKYDGSNENSTTFIIGTNGTLILNNCDLKIRTNAGFDIRMIYGNASLIINGGRFTTKSSVFATYIDSAKIFVNNAYFYDCTSSNYAIFNPYPSGGDRVYPADIILNNCIFEGNKGKLGSVVSMNAGSLTVNGGRFVNNTATVGGVFYINALNGADCPVNINGAVFEGNSTSGTYVLSTADYDVKHSGSGEDTDTVNTLAGAGAIFCTQPLTITNSRFLSNSANITNGSGGAIFITSKKASMELNNCYFNKNISNLGGAIRLIKPGNEFPIFVNISNSIFKENRAFDSGGAICYSSNEKQENSKIINCEFIENETTTGAGGAAYGAGFIFYDCLFSKNKAYTTCGAIWNGYKVYNSTFSYNYAYAGAATISWTDAYNCIFYQNNGGAFIIENSNSSDCEIYNNKAGKYIIYLNSITKTLKNCNIFENYSISQGIFNSSTVIFDANLNCRIYNNYTESPEGIVNRLNLSGCEIFENYCAGDYATLTGTYSNVTFANNVTASPSGGFAVDGAVFSGKIDVYGNRIGADYREKTFTVGTDNTSVTIRIPIVGTDGKLQGGTPNDTTLWEDDGTVAPFMISYSTPTLNLPLDITTLASGQDLSQWVSGATIKDSTGQLVSGTWKSTGGTLAYATTTLSLQFYPIHVGKYSQEYLSVTVDVKRQANAIYYVKVNGVNNFYLVSSPTAASPILGISIEQAVNFLANNGTFSFLTPYIVPAGASISLSTDSKNLTFVRSHTGEMFNVATGGFLQLGARIMTGKILLDGGSGVSAVSALIVNAGTLNIYGKVFIASARNVNGSEGQGGAIFNAGTADLNFAEIRDCRAVAPVTETGFGGAIYNAGTMNLANVKISDCLAPSGGAIFSAGKLNMTNCFLSGNKGWQIGSKDVDVLGNAIRVQGGDDAVFKMTDCNISSSYAATVDATTAVGASVNVYGGALYVQGEIDAEINFSTISNCSAMFGGGIFVGETGNLKAKNVVIQNCKTFNIVGSAIFSTNADNVMLDDCLFVANATTAGTVQPGEDGLHGTTGSFVLTSANLFADEESQADVKTSADNLIVAFALLGLLASFALAVMVKTKFSKARKK